MNKDWRDKLIDGGYILPLVFALLLVMAFGAMATAQTKSEVLEYCKSIGIESPEFVTAQAQLETGYFKSYGCKHRNNLFGFWNGEKYLEFKTWQESIEFYKSWMQRKGLNKYGDLKTLLLNEWKAPNMENYIKKVEWIKSNM